MVVGLSLAGSLVPSWTAPDDRTVAAMTYDDPRLAAVYDIDNPDGPDHDFFRQVADEIGAGRIVDLGCGTGILTVTLTGPGRMVTGIDPAGAMLRYAAARPGGAAVTWIEGTAEQMDARVEVGSIDLVIMSGNTAMHIIGEAWQRTLASIARALRSGGRLVFETRNPETRAWEGWNDPVTERDTPAGRLRESMTTDPPNTDGVVVMHIHNEFVETGEALDGDVHLQFRSRDQIESDLAHAGMRTVGVWRDWRRTPFTGAPTEVLMIVEASPAYP